MSEHDRFHRYALTIIVFLVQFSSNGLEVQLTVTWAFFAARVTRDRDTSLHLFPFVTSVLSRRSSLVAYPEPCQSPTWPLCGLLSNYSRPSQSERR